MSPTPASFIRRHRFKLMAVAVIVLLLLLRVSACSRAPEQPQWLTATVREGDLEQQVLANGVLRANKLVNVGAQVSGQVKALHVALGEYVRQGQLIAEIDATEQQSALRDERASIAISRAQRAARVSAVEQAQANVQRQEMMMREDATSQQELQAAQAQLVNARSDLAVLDAQLRQQAIKLEAASTKLAYTRIVAPMDGVVVAVVTEAGQTLNAVQSVPTVIRLAQLDPMLVEAQISEADVPQVRAGMPAWFTLLGDEHTRYDSRLRSVDPGPSDLARDSVPSTSASAVYYNALLEVPNPDGALRIAMTAKVHIVTRKASAVRIVPAAALGARSADGQYQVRVLSTDGKGQAQVSQRMVRIGLNNRVDAEVLEGLQVGDEVIIGQVDARNPLMDAEPGAGEP